jgi:hypothetical protein
MPFEVAVMEFVDSSYDDLMRQYTQSRLKSRRDPPTEQELQALEQEAERFMDDVLPAKILEALDLDRMGYDRFVQQRLNEVFLNGVVDSVMNGLTEAAPSRAASLLVIAARVAASS